MPVDIFSTQVLNKTVEYLDRPASFLLDTFFGQVQTADTEEIFFDIDKSKPRLTPFVSPLVAGKVVADSGYETKSFKPAYAKDKRRFDPSAPLKRTIGERIGGTLTPQQRRDAALNRSLTNQLENLTRREEVMASEALRLGQVTVSGDNYPTVVVNFQRDAALTVTLTGGNRWGQAGIKPLDNLEDWASLVQTKSGAAAKTVIMDPAAWRLFRNSDDVKALLTIYRGTNSAFQVDPLVRGQGNEKARFPENRRERFLSEQEFAALESAMQRAERNLTESPHVLAMFRIMMHTGCRPGEARYLKWDYVDLTNRVIRLPKEATKEKRPKTLFITPYIEGVLKNIRRMEGNPYVIVSERNDGKPIADVKKPWDRIKKAAGITTELHLHDLRHSHASMANALGYSLPMIGALLGHTQAQTTLRYAHLATDHLRQAAEDISNRIAGVAKTTSPMPPHDKPRANLRMVK